MYLSNNKKYKINHTPISTIKPTSYLYLSLNSSSSFSPKKKKKKYIIFPPNKLLMFLLLMTSPFNLNCLKFNNQSSLFLSLFDLSSPYLHNKAHFLSISISQLIIFPPNKLLMFLLLMTSLLNLNCLKFNNQSSLSLSLSFFLTYHLLILWFVLDFFFFHFSIFSLFLYIHVYNFSIRNCILTIKIVVSKKLECILLI